MSIWDKLNICLSSRPGIYSLKLSIHVKIFVRFDFMWNVYLWQICNISTRTSDNIRKKVFLLVEYQNSVYQKTDFSEAYHYNNVTLISTQ